MPVWVLKVPASGSQEVPILGSQVPVFRCSTLEPFFGLPRKQKIGVKKKGLNMWNWRGMPTILGVNFLGGLKP